LCCFHWPRLRAVQAVFKFCNTQSTGEQRAHVTTYELLYMIKFADFTGEFEAVCEPMDRL
jgi:hypothetical protein